MARLPDYHLKAMDKALNIKSQNIGGAWTNDDGSISIKLDWPAVLTAGPNLVLTLFPLRKFPPAGPDVGDGDNTPF